MPTTFNKFLGKWSVEKVEDMDHMFDGATEFDQNLTCWDVEHVENTPEDFATGSKLTPDHLPKFGHAPNIGCSELLHEPLTSDAFIIRVVVGSSDKTFTLPIRTGPANIMCSVYWGDDTFSDIDTTDSPKWTHSYSAAGSYDIAVVGTCFAPDFTDSPSVDKITNIVQWGNLTGATDWSNAFQGCYLLTTIDASDSFGAGVVDTSGMFYNCYSFLGNNTLGSWDMSSVVDVSEMFFNCYNFNQSLTSWNTGSVEYMDRVFAASSPSNRTMFNNAINGWNVASVKTMVGMFENTGAFNQPLNSWVTSSLVDTSSMFRNAMYFNKDLKTFDMSKVVDTSYMFYEAGSFNKNIGSWNVSSVETFDHFFGNNETFNKNLSCWNVNREVSHTDFVGSVTLMTEANLPKWGQEPNTDCNYDEPDLSAFIIEIEISYAGDSFIWPVRHNAIYDCYINWGDSLEYTNITSSEILDPVWEHQYDEPGRYNITIKGIAGAPCCKVLTYEYETNSNAEKVRNIRQWGALEGATDWSGAFYGCYNLTTVSATDQIQSGVTNMSEMFYSCDNLLNTPFLSNWDVSNVTDMSGMLSAYNFNQDLSNWDVSNVTDMSGMFYGVQSINNNVGFNNWDVSNVTDMSWMFHWCITFNEDLSNWDVSNVTDMSYMFDECRAFNSNISAWNVANVTNTQNMFYDCRAFNSDISTWNVSNVTNMFGMFNGCILFNSDISAWNVSNVTNMAYTFNGCKIFNSDISAWNVSNVTNMSNMFYGCTAFNQDLSNWNVANVTNMSWMFAYAKYFNSDISMWNVANVTDMSYMFYNNLTFFDQKFCQNLSCWNVSQNPTHVAFASYLPSYFFPKWGLTAGTGCTTIVNKPFVLTIYISSTNTTFYWPTRAQTTDMWIDWGDGSTPLHTTSQTAVSHVYAPGFYNISVYGTAGAPKFSTQSASATKVRNVLQWGNLIGATDWSSAFYGCSTLSGFSAIDSLQPNITNMSGMFYGCSAFNGDITNWDVANVTNMGSMFYGCTVFNKDLNWNTVNVTDMSYMFRGCAAFNGNITNWDVSNVTNMSYMFYGCTVFNKDLNWNTINVTNMYYMFRECSTFNKDLNFNTISVTNMSYMFYGCTVFNKDLNWNTINVTNMSYMFQLCTAFNGNISAWNVAKVTNMISMFYGCTAFNQYIGGWNVAKVTNRSSMLRFADAFSQNLSCWNVATSSNQWLDLNDCPNLPRAFFPRWGLSPNVGCVANSPYSARPIITSPTNNAIDTPGPSEIGPLTITTNNFSCINGSDTHLKTSWTCCILNSPASIVAQSLNDTTNLTSWTITNQLLPATWYSIINVTHIGTLYGESAYNTTISFRTASTSGYLESSTLMINPVTIPTDIVYDSNTLYAIGKTAFARYSKLRQPDGSWSLNYNYSSSALPTITTTTRSGTLDSAGYLWVTNPNLNSITKVSLSGSQIGTYTVGNNPTAILYAAGYVWVTNTGDTTVSQINISTGATINTISVASNPTAITFDGTYIWAASSSASSFITKIEASTGTVITTQSLSYATNHMIYDGTYIWIATQSTKITKFNPINAQEIISYSTNGPDIPLRLLSIGSYLWIAYTAPTGNLSRMYKLDGSIYNFSMPNKMITRLIYDNNYIYASTYNTTTTDYSMNLIKS